MSTAQVLLQLRAWEEALTARDPAWTTYLRPGLSETEVREACAPYGVTPTQDVIALWGWHDGDRADYAEDWGRPSVIPGGGLFLSLKAALERSLARQRITMGGDDDMDYSEEEINPREGQNVQLYFRRTFLVLSEDQNALYLDCADPDAIDTPTAVFLSHDIVRSPRLTLAERLTLWNQALRAGVWPDAPESWSVDQGAAHAARPDDGAWLDWAF